MSRKDWFIQLISTVVLGTWISFLHSQNLGGISSLIGILVGVLAVGFIIGFTSVRNLKQAVMKGSLPLLIIVVGYLAYLGIAGMLGPGDDRYLIGVLIFAPVSVLSGSLGAWMRS